MPRLYVTAALVQWVRLPFARSINHRSRPRLSCGVDGSNQLALQAHDGAVMLVVTAFAERQLITRGLAPRACRLCDRQQLR